MQSYGQVLKKNLLYLEIIMVKFDCGKDNFYFRMDDEHGIECEDENDEEEQTIILEKRCDSRLFILLVNSYFLLYVKSPGGRLICLLAILSYS